MLMGLGGLFKNGLVEWGTSMTYQAASGGGARHMRELLNQFGAINGAVAAELARPGVRDPGDRPQGPRQQRSPSLDATQFGVPLAGSRDPVDRRGPRQRPVQGRVEGRGGDQQDPGHVEAERASPSTDCACGSAPCAPTRRR